MLPPPSAVDAAYARLLSQHRAETVAALARAIQEGDLLYGDRPLVQLATPVFRTEEQYADLCASAGRVTRAIYAAARWVAGEPEVLRMFDVAPEDAPLLRRALDSGPPVVMRLDSLWPLDAPPRFIECNAGTGGVVVGGVAYGPGVAAAFAELPPLRALTEEYDARSFHALSLFYDGLVEAHHRRGGEGAPHVVGALLGQPTRTPPRGQAPDVYSKWQADGATAQPNVLSREVLRGMGYVVQRGAKVQLVEAAQAELRGGRLLANGDAVDILIAIGQDLGWYEPDHPVVRAVREGAVATLDGWPAGNVLGNKRLFAVLTDPAYGLRLDEELRAEVERCVPCTREVKAGETTWHGERVDLERFALANRERLVLKPGDGLAGVEVVLGDRVDDAAWAEALRAALQGGFVLQERVTPAIGRFAPASGEAEEQELFYDVNPYVWGGARVEAAFVRTSARAIVNVARGGSVVPLFVVRKR